LSNAVITIVDKATAAPLTGMVVDCEYVRPLPPDPIPVPAPDLFLSVSYQGVSIPFGSTFRRDERSLRFSITTMVVSGVSTVVGASSNPAWVKVLKVSGTQYALEITPPNPAPGQHANAIHAIAITAIKDGLPSTFEFRLEIRRVWRHDDETVYLEPRVTSGLVKEVKRSGNPVALIVRGHVVFGVRAFNYWQAAYMPTPAVPTDMYWRLVLHRPDQSRVHLSDVRSGLAALVQFDSTAVPDGTYAVTVEFVEGSTNPASDITRYIERPQIVIVDNQTGAAQSEILPVPAASEDGYRNRWRGPMEAVQWVWFNTPSEQHVAHPYPYKVAVPPATDAARQLLVNTNNLVNEPWLGPLNNRYTTESTFVQTAEGHPFIGHMTWSGLDYQYLPFTKRYPERDGSRNNSAVNTMTQFRPVPGPDPSLVGIGIDGRLVKIDPRAQDHNLVQTIAGWVLDPNKLPLFDDSSPNYEVNKKLFGTFEGGLLFRQPTDLVFDNLDPKYVYVADAQNHRIAQCNLTTGNVTTFAGDVSIKDAYGVPSPGYLDGFRLQARFSQPHSLEILNGVMYVADKANNAIRAINMTTSQVTTVLGRGATAPTVPTDLKVLAQQLPAWTFSRVAFDASPICYPIWIRKDSRGNLLVQEFGSEGAGTGNLRRMEFATSEVVQIRARGSLGESFEVDYLGRIGPVDDIIVQHIPQTSALGRLGADGATKGVVTTLGSPNYYGRGESNPLYTEGGSPYGVRMVIDDQEAKLGFTSVYRSSFTVLRPRLPSDPPSAHDAVLYDEGRAVAIAGTVQAFAPNRARSGFTSLHGRFGHNWLGSTATFDDLVSTSDAELADYIVSEGLGTGVARPEITAKDLQAMIYFVRMTSLQGKLETISPATLKANLQVAGYWPADTTPPVISGVRLDPVSANAIRLQWTTDEPCVCVVHYGHTDYYGQAVDVESEYTLAHESVIEFVVRAPRCLKIIARDRSGNITIKEVVHA
jgi:hypothetical protein